MNILQILPELNVGGVETGTLDFAKYLVAAGHKSVVVSAGGALVEDLERGGSKHYILPVQKKNIFLMMAAARKLAAIIRDEDIDIVHARSRVPVWVAFFACRKTKAALVTTCHGYYAPHLFSRAMGWGKRVIAISEVIGRHMVQDFKVPPEVVRIIPRSVDLSRFQIARAVKAPGEPKVVTMIGRITPLKGHPYFLKAMAQVMRQFPDVRVKIIGDAPSKKKAYKDELVLLARRLGLSNNVEFLGNRRDIPELLAQSDCLVLSTVTQEAFGRVILEAQAAGVPVVATRVGGVIEIIEDGKTGLLVMPKDPPAMAKAVLRLLTDSTLAQKIVEQSQKRIDERYTIRHMADATIKVYEEVLNSMNILVVKLTAVGDIILSTAALAALRGRFPHAQVHCLTSPEGSAVLQRCPYLNNVILFDPHKKNFKAVWDMGDDLRSYRFDKVIDLQNNRLSHILAFLCLAKESYGYDNGKFSFLLSHKIKDDIPGLSPVPHQFRILKMLGIDYNNSVRLELWTSPRDEEYAQSLLDGEWMGGGGEVVGINIAASAQWQTKNWPVDHIVKLCDMLGARNIRVVLTGQQKDKGLARLILHKTKAKPADFTGKTNLLQLAALISRCKAYVSPDSAPLHIAAAMRVPVVALFGPTDPKRHMPPADKSAVFARPLKCAPCYSGTCKIKTHACMQEILPEDVAGKVREFIESRERHL